MNELTRMQYLDAMGIDSFVPRFILPAAKVSSACALPVEWIDEAMTVDAAPDYQRSHVAQATSPLPAVAQSIVKELLVPSKALLTDTPIAPSDERTLQKLLVKKRPQVLRFSLSVWQLDSGVVFIDSREPKAALPTSTLLHNIVQVFAHDAVIPKPDIINWPLLHSDVTNPNEIQEAQEMTQAFLASRFEVVVPKAIVVMGEAAAHMVLQTEKSEYGESYSFKHLPSPAIYLPSLAALLKQPLLKRYIWTALKPWF